ncbi:MAG: class II fumarate hydratase [Phycisphaerales bacterium]|nr:class II fumarate hydratase [Planctomycetota bacterium]MCH8508281.1 class II fumarate hydratase [Phycisphaerales bacterium]
MVQAAAKASGDTRIEKDSMGAMPVPADVLYGASTQRAVLNFPISGRPVPDELIRAYAMLKAAAARANATLGKLEEPRARAIEGACGEILAGLKDRGGLARHFPVDIFQTGSGTSTNMNVNEVVANLVCLANGDPIGSSKNAEYLNKDNAVHPNDHVNMGQSSNDTFPTAMHVAAAVAIHQRLLPAVRAMADELQAKADAWDSVIKIGRTHLQDATPIRLGQEFSGYAAQMRHAEDRLMRALAALGELAIGGTAVGTGINTHPRFAGIVCEQLSQATGISFREAANHFEAQHAKDGFVEVSGLLRTIAVSLTKIANDIRWLGSGPRCGIGELKLPAVQPGSSIMPGKVNPVICEAVIMVACQVIGNDAAVAAGGLGGVGSLIDLNVAMPVMAANLIDSINLLAGACETFQTNLLAGLEPDEARCNALIEGSLAMCTSLVPEIGYDASAKLAYEAFEQGKTVRELALEQGLIPEGRLAELLDPRSMTEPDA